MTKKIREGSLDKPTRHVVDWKNPQFLDEQAIDDELRRVFDICHGCRRCFNLCDSFPTLFDLIDETDGGEVENVNSNQFDTVTNGCTLCDMCYMTKCPYVPPHSFDLDFPHLMVRHKALLLKQGKVKWSEKQLNKMDRNGSLGTKLSGFVNTLADSAPVRKATQSLTQIHPKAPLPAYRKTQLADKTPTYPEIRDEPAVHLSSQPAIKLNTKTTAYGKKVALFATCYQNFCESSQTMAILNVLAHNGIETEVFYDGCCGMPQLELGDLAAVEKQALKLIKPMRDWHDRGYTVVAPVPSCAFMIKSEWPLFVPDNKDIAYMSRHMWDLSEYLVHIHKTLGLITTFPNTISGASLQLSCHARAQNMGQKAAELLRIIPNIKVDVIEKCSGHGGSWGYKKDNFDTAQKLAKPALRLAARHDHPYVLSECPLARDHLKDVTEKQTKDNKPAFLHPIEILAKAYGF
jgi:glycerol-3-phosphate dehydrogenase subunit C